MSDRTKYFTMVTNRIDLHRLVDRMSRLERTLTYHAMSNLAKISRKSRKFRTTIL